MANSKEDYLKVIDLVENGMPESTACEKVGINRSTFRHGVVKHKIDNIYAHALESLAHVQIQKMEQTITDMREKKIDAQMARVEIDARKWFASKFLPKKYGEKLDVTSGGDKIQPILGGLSKDVPSDDSSKEAS